MMRCFFLNLASHDGLLACATGESVAASVPADHRIGDHELTPLIERTLREAGWTYADLTHIACVTGPGGFTSLRVAVSVANTLAGQLRIPAADIHLSDLCAARVSASQDFLWFHSTRKKEVFVRGFGAHAVLWPGPTHLTLDDLLPRIPEGAGWTGELIPEHLEALGPKRLQALPRDPAERILPGFLAGRVFGSDLLLPWYGRGW